MINVESPAAMLPCEPLTGPPDRSTTVYRVYGLSAATSPTPQRVVAAADPHPAQVGVVLALRIVTPAIVELVRFECLRLSGAGVREGHRQVRLLVVRPLHMVVVLVLSEAERPWLAPKLRLGVTTVTVPVPAF